MRFDLVFIGRISVEKNQAAPLQAIKPLDVSIAIIGGARQGGWRNTGSGATRRMI